MTVETNDPNIGETFEDRDSRSAGRRIKVLSAFKKRDRWNDLYPAYRVETILNPGSPSSVGNKSSVSAANLSERYRKVSH